MKKRLTGLVSIGVLIAGSRAGAQEKKGDASRGKAVFEQCAVCHSADAWRTAGLATRKGPSLRGLFRKQNLRNGKPVNDANVLEVIDTGGKGMSPYKDVLTAQQKADVIAFLRTQ